MTVGYHDVAVGMRFEEVTEKRPRIVRVTKTSLYQTLCVVERGRGLNMTLSVFRRALSDPKRWKLVPKEQENA